MVVMCVCVCVAEKTCLGQFIVVEDDEESDWGVPCLMRWST